MFYIYVLQSIKKGNLYTGYTADLRKRLKEHNQGLNQSTKPYRPWNLIYYEAYKKRDIAQKRERQLKSGKAHMELKKRLKTD